MDFLRAVKGPSTRAGSLRSIQSAAETELRRPLSEEELSYLISKYSLDGLYSNIQKVYYKKCKF